MGTQSADGKVLDRAGGLNAVIGVGRNFFESERVFFGAGGWLGHECCPQQRDDSGGDRAAGSLRSNLSPRAGERVEDPAS
jgi:hypothetical protein